MQNTHRSVTLAAYLDEQGPIFVKEMKITSKVSKLAEALAET